MCSISGIIGIAGCGEAVQRMNAAQVHRGPDDLVSRNVSFQVAR